MADSNHPRSNFDKMRLANRDLLSLSLIDSRNHLLQRLDRFDGAPQALWLAGQAGWFQEWWIARNVQRHLGQFAEGGSVRLASAWAQADPLWRGERAASQVAQDTPAMSVAQVKDYLLATLETTLELLDKTPETDAALYFFRLSLLREDQRNEDLLVLGQQLGVNFLKPDIGISLPAPGGVREPLWMAATRWTMGLDAAQGFAMDNQSPPQEVQLPEYEIDAQAVTWQQYVEFVLDGAYDREELWHPKGWAWLNAENKAESRRAPRFVDQIGGATGAVLQNHFGQPMRMLGTQPAMHLSWWEADAWVRWAGRRLPSEAEWEAAAHLGARRGFRWGEVWEWCANNFHAYGDTDGDANRNFVAGPWLAGSQPYFGSHKVLRGASFATTRRITSPQFRHFDLPGADGGFYGFRSCAI